MKVEKDIFCTHNRGHAINDQSPISSQICDARLTEPVKASWKGTHCTSHPTSTYPSARAQSIPTSPSMPHHTFTHCRPLPPLPGRNNMHTSSTPTSTPISAARSPTHNLLQPPRSLCELGQHPRIINTPPPCMSSERT